MDRRSFLFGLGAGVLGGASMGFLINPFAFASSAESGENFASDGANQPNGGPVLGTSALYDSGMTWVAWEAWNGTTRIPTITGYNNSTGYWRDKTAVGISALVDDDHGIPSIRLDHEGHLHVFYGAHHSDVRHSSSIEPIADNSTRWRVNADITGSEYTYPHPSLVGSSLYLFLRKRIAASTKMVLTLRKTATLSAGVATWDSEITLVDLGTDSITYIGTVEENGTDIWILITKADYLDTKRENVYLFLYDTTTGAVKNHDGSTSVASGGLPVGLASADANFKLFDHSGTNHDGGGPTLCFDTSGDPHVLFKDGTGSPSGSFDVKHIKRTSGTWDAPVSIGTVTSRYNCPTPVPLSGGRVEAWYPLGANRFGDMTRRERSAAGVWGAEINVMTAGSDGLGNPNKVFNGQADARVIWSECLDDPTDAAAGNLKSYLFGAGGTIPYQAEPAEINSGTADGHELREDGDDALREAGDFELRETA